MATAKKKQNSEYKERKSVGQFFTEASLVSDIKDTFNLDFNGKEIIEPSCGEGVFIKEILKYDVKMITGIDIDKKVLKKINIDDDRLSLLNKDFLIDDFNKVDMIIGNPPFNLPTKNYLDSTEGFLMKSIDLLKDNGELILIMPSTILRNKNYQTLRNKILSETKIIGIINTSKYEFLGADIETVVIYLKKEKVKKQIYNYYIDREKKKINLTINSRQTILLNNTKIYTDMVNKIKGVRLDELFTIRRGNSKDGLNGRKIDFYNDRHMIKNTNDECCFIAIQNIAYRLTANAIKGSLNEVKDTVTLLIPKKKISFDELRYIACFLNSSISFYNLHNNCLNNCRLTIHIDKYYIEDFIVPIPSLERIKSMDENIDEYRRSIEYSNRRNLYFYKEFQMDDKEIYEVEKFWTNPKFKLKEEVELYVCE
ncbi:MAG: N-6 DNA methylase [Bacilli bacterium]|nr:N-6 DNA methylase [Bacilli bacterium]